MEFLAVIITFIVFFIILGKGFLAALNPVSLLILIFLSVAVGYAVIGVFGFVFGAVLKVLPVIIIVGIIIVFIRK